MYGKVGGELIRTVKQIQEAVGDGEEEKDTEGKPVAKGSKCQLLDGSFRK